MEKLWVLPDMQSGVAGVQYGMGSDPHQHDGDMLLSPTNPSGSRRLVQVAPNLEDLPEPRRAEYWIAAADQDGLADLVGAATRVFRPDGALLEGIQMTRQDCSALGGTTMAATLLEAAVHTGQMTEEEAARLAGGCAKGDIALFMAAGSVSVAAPPGEYGLQITVADQAEAVGAMEGWFDVLPVAGVTIDFSRLDFGVVTPHEPKRIEGDRLFNPPDDARPTVKNVGNSAVQVQLGFSDLVGATRGAAISSFDAQLEGERAEAMAANSPARSVGKLAPNQVAGLDFTLRPAAIPSDVYQGKLYLSAKLEP